MVVAVSAFKCAISEMYSRTHNKYLCEMCLSLLLALILWHVFVWVTLIFQPSSNAYVICSFHVSKICVKLILPCRSTRERERERDGGTWHKYYKRFRSIMIVVPKIPLENNRKQIAAKTNGLRHVIIVQLKIDILDSENGKSHHMTKTQNGFIKFSQLVHLPIILGLVKKKRVAYTCAHIYTGRQAGRETDRHEKHKWRIHKANRRLSQTDLVLWFDLIGIYLLYCQNHWVASELKYMDIINICALCTFQSDPIQYNVQCTYWTVNKH